MPCSKATCGRPTASGGKCKKCTSKRGTPCANHRSRPSQKRPSRPAGSRPSRPAGRRPSRPAGRRPSQPLHLTLSAIRDHPMRKEALLYLATLKSMASKLSSGSQCRGTPKPSLHGVPCNDTYCAKAEIECFDNVCRRKDPQFKCIHPIILRNIRRHWEIVNHLGFNEQSELNGYIALINQNARANDGTQLQRF